MKTIAVLLAAAALWGPAAFLIAQAGAAPSDWKALLMNVVSGLIGGAVAALSNVGARYFDYKKSVEVNRKAIAGLKRQVDDGKREHDEQIKGIRDQHRKDIDRAVEDARRKAEEDASEIQELRWNDHWLRLRLQSQAGIVIPDPPPPGSPEAMKAMSQSGITIPAVKKGTILIVDDSATAAQQLAKVLRSKGWVTRSASSVVGALESMSSVGVPDIVLLDLRLPGMPGTKLLERMRQDKIRSDVLIVTAYPDSDLAVEAQQLGARAIVQKPYDPVVLLRLLDGDAADDVPSSWN